MTVESEVSLTSVNGGRLPGFLARPETDTPGPAIVMIYEIFGMTPEMRRIARELAREGYTVLIPDLFARGRVKPLCIASTLATMATGRGAALGDCESARRWLADQPTVDADRIGVMGFCMGGGFALLLSQTGLYRVAVPFYGRAGVAVEPVCPVVASFGGRDLQFADGYPQRLEADLAERGIPHDVVVYPEAGHSFMTRTPGAKGAVARRTPLHAEYHEPSATDATERVRAFLHDHL
ncbi:dienelactone hydrolase [Pseudonocardia sp. Ae406_Ps2]|uniref:dienelactone hydrolase family protein n=1 Tax=unclassified Pseudonocardia TaxID=2619320 RepID=UPI000310DA31|nr:MULTISPECIES: dienelactone hydrolase family protein [unclassified Pseudonocardia]OLM00174.1 dienelactone hydrolase [Pseudonocardia sp. Ae406_Ps2]OLM08032.1 dienelactone hydrolase [Pseudonocardia sp. Ae331_Ps2]OLM21743.1 dienelactone hydrolase [Pseudonocardia sp. Ae706_Ps2]OLM30860.1 dienelactone hydrolase [Pseudonocardia sp. Ae717_Ps2]